MPHRLNMTLLAGVAAMALAGCREDAPPTSGPLFVPAATEAAYELPVPQPGPLAAAPAQPMAAVDYSYAERAYALDRAFHEAPPDYGFSYMNAEPWAWRSSDGYEMYAEPIDDSYRYYYYEPGADQPFFVRAPDYSYGYDPRGFLSVVYSSGGVIVPRAYRDRRFDHADRYWKRARHMRAAAHRHHRPVVRETWISRRPALVASQRPWMKAAVERPEWRRYRERDRDRDIRRFDKERERRIEVARRFDRDDVRRVRARDDDRRPQRAFDRPRAEPPRRAERDERLMRAERREARVQQAKLERREERPARNARADRPERQPPRVQERGPDQRAARPERVAKAEPPRREMARPDRPNREARNQERRASERPERAAERRPERAERRPERAERRPERAERPRQAARQEREPRQVARQERSARLEQAQRGKDRGGDRQQARAERKEGGARGKPERQERGRSD